MKALIAARIERCAVVAAVCAIFAILFGTPTAAQANCMARIVGSWLWTAQGYPTVNMQVQPGGAASTPYASATFTCQGNQYVSNTGNRLTMSADGRRMTGVSAIGIPLNVVRQGAGVPAAVKQAAVQPTKKPEATPLPGPAQTGRAANCSDISGTGGPRIDCKPAQGGAAPATAQPAAKPAPVKTAPPVNPPVAAGAPSDDPAALIGRLIEGRTYTGPADPPRTNPSGAASRLPPPPPAADGLLAEAERQANLPGGKCITDFLNLRKKFRDNAATCAQETRLIQSLTATVDSPIKAGQDPHGEDGYRRQENPELHGFVPSNDPRWKKSENFFTPVCTLPVEVDSQSESFTECARLNLCGIRAATCGIQQALARATDDCVSISMTCLAQNPIPPLSTAARVAPQPVPRATTNTPHPQGMTAPRSGISGSSGGAGNDTSYSGSAR